MLKHIRICAIAAVTAAVATSAAAPAAHAFDLEDYATTYRATRDAYFKSEAEYFDAVNPFRLQLGIMALYGYVGTGTDEGYAGPIYNDPSTGYLEHIGVDIADRPAWCNEYAFGNDRAAPALPERVRGAVARFVVGSTTSATLDYNSNQYQAAAIQSYLHFRTQGGTGDAVSVVSAFIQSYPYPTEGQRTDHLSALAEAQAWRAAGHPSWAPNEAGYVSARTLRAAYQFYVIEDDLATMIRGVNELVNVDNLPAPWWQGQVGGYCFDDQDLCGVGETCIDISGSPWTGSYGTNAGWPNGGKYNYRCINQNAPLFVWPPEPRDVFSEGYRPTLGASNDPNDAPGFHYTNGVLDIEDLMTRFRAKRDAYLKAKNERYLARAPFEAARAAHAISYQTYLADFDKYKQ